MKKIFTSISMALCLAASSFNASAQQATQLSDAQKQEIQQKVLPVVFEQIKEQAGIDILGWAQPKLTADYLGSLPIFGGLNNGLRAATDINVQPDSIKIDVTKLGLGLVGNMAGVVTVEFEEPTVRTIPVIGGFIGRNITVSVPDTIRVTSSTLKEVAVIGIELSGNDGELVPFGMDMSISLMRGEEKDMLDFTFTQNSETDLLEAKVDIQEGMRNLWGVLGMIGVPALPEPATDYLITMSLNGIFTGQLPLSLYGLPEDGGENVSMGDAIVNLNLAAIEQGGSPIQSIDVTSYDETGNAKDWSRLGFTLSQANAQDLVLTIDNIGYDSADKTNATTRSITIITMTDNTANVTNPQTAVQAVVQNVVSQLANEGEVAPYAMSIETIAQDTNGDAIINNNDEAAPVMDVTVTPSFTETGAGATINIQSYTNGEVATVVDLVATATTEKVQLDVEMGGAVIGSAYFTSNILGAVTSNEDIQVVNVEVTPVKDGIYVSGTTTATYSIVSMSGAIVANGTVSGDNAYISTSALAKGIYVIVVTENGESKAIKFAR